MFSEALTPEELSARWKGRITVGTLANWRSRGYGPGFTKVGARVLYPLESVITWEKAQHNDPSVKETTP